MANLLNFNPLLIVLLVLWTSLSQAVPTVFEFEKDVLGILDTRAGYQRDYTTFEKHITWLIKTGDKQQVLQERAYRRSMELIRTNRWQEAIWTLKRGGLVTHGNALENFLGLAMEHMDAGGAYLTGEGINRSSLATIKLNDNRSIEVLAKAGDASTPLATEAEVGAHRIDDFFNLNIVALTTSGKSKGFEDTSLQLIVPDMRYSGVNFRDRGYQYAFPEVYFLDFLMGNLDRHYENSGYTRGKRFFAFDHGRLLAYGATLKPLEIHTQPFDKNYQLPYMVEQKIRTTTVDQFVAALKAMAFPQIAIDYMAVTYASAKKAIESRPTLAPPIDMVTNSHVGPNRESPLMAFVGRQVEALIKKRHDEREAARLKAIEAEETLNRFFEEQNRQMEVQFMEMFDDSYLRKLNECKQAKDFEYLLSLDRVMSPGERQAQMLDKMLTVFKKGRITHAEFLNLHARFLRLRLPVKIREEAERVLNHISTKAAITSCHRFYLN